MKILNFGSLNIDYTYDVDHFVRGGETLSSKALHLFPGGKGLNQSIAASRSGADVWHAGAVGKSDGEFLIKQLNEAGVNTDYVKRLEVPSGHAIIQRQPDGGNCILLFGGSNQAITRGMADEVLEHFGKGDYLLLQNEISEVGYIMKRAAEKGMRIVLNPSPMDEKIGKLPLENVDYFLLNEVEAESLCGEGANRPEAMMEKLTKGFPKAKIVLTLGSQGSLYWDGEKMIKQPCYKVKAVDTTAAGDTFTGFFIGGLSQGMEGVKALDWAARAAAVAVSRAGAATSIPSKEEVDRFSGI